VFLFFSLLFYLSGQGRPGLIAYYTFASNALLLDEANSLGDLQASGNPSSTSDCPWFGSQCVALSSVGDSSSGIGQYFRVNTLNLGAMSESTGFSICSWFVCDASTSWARIFDFGLGPANNNVLFAPCTYNTPPQVHYYCGSESNVIVLPNSIINGQWRHVCVVNQGRSWSVYDDGVMAVSQTATCSLNSVPLTSNFIGRSNWPLNSLLIGRVDEFRIYQKSLLPSDVASIYGGACSFLYISLLASAYSVYSILSSVHSLFLHHPELE
jgi:hypothetical protein